MEWSALGPAQNSKERDQNNQKYLKMSSFLKIWVLSLTIVVTNENKNHGLEKTS